MEKTLELTHTSGRSYRAYVLAAFILVYTFNFVDRILISIVQEPLRLEFGLSDKQLGLLGGPAFAILYSLSAIPIARLAERVNRVTVISVGLAVWSSMTALSGLATSYAHLFLARIGVGIGEASCAPSAHAVVSDYFPPASRASAISIMMLGVPIGTLIASFGGGWVTENVDWRMAFVVMGLPGIAFAFVLRATVRDPGKVARTSKPQFFSDMSALMRRRSFVHLSLAGAFLNFFGYGMTLFLVSHLVRTLDASLGAASMLFGIALGVGGILGLIGGGWATDWLKKSHPTAEVWLPAVAILVSIPVFVGAFATGNFLMCGILIFVGITFFKSCIGPIFSSVQNVAGPTLRPTAAAIALLVSNLIGYCLGPLFVGVASDAFAAHQMSQSGLSMAVCAQNADVACAIAKSNGLKLALIVSTASLAIAALHLVLARKTLQEDTHG